MRYGYLDPVMLRAMITCWRALLQANRVEVLIADHAPTALIAARSLGVPTAVIGTPFAVPPDVQPTPNMRQWVQVPAARLEDSDARVLATVNAALPAGMPAIPALRWIFSGAEQFLLGLPETDPYGPRDAAIYFGLLGRSTGTAMPAWPVGTGKRVVAYLNANYPHIEAAVQALSTCGARVIAYVPGANQKILQQFATSSVSVATEPVDMVRLLNAADLCVTHGPNTVLAALQAGVPLLILPKQLENFLFARALQREGVCQLVNPELPDPDIKGALTEMLANPEYSLAARGFAGRHLNAAIGTIVEQVVARIEALAAGPSEGRT